MSLYSKWQQLDLYGSVHDFVSEFRETPKRSKAMVLLLLLISYFLILWIIVRILSSDSLKEES